MVDYNYSCTCSLLLLLLLFMLFMTGAPPEPMGDRVFVVGDLVKVELDADTFEMMQEGHGGWADSMPEVHNIM